MQIKAASRLGINRNTLHKKLSEYQMYEANIGGTDKMPRSSTSNRRNGNTDDLNYSEGSERPFPTHRADCSRRSGLNSALFHASQSKSAETITCFFPVLRVLGRESDLIAMSADPDTICQVCVR